MWGRKGRKIKKLESSLKWYKEGYDEKCAIIRGFEWRRTHKDECSDLVECETCGCAVFKGSAVKGKAEVKTKKIEKTFPWIPVKYETDEEYIHHPYYCKAHDPNKVKEPLCGKTKKAGNK